MSTIARIPIVSCDTAHRKQNLMTAKNKSLAESPIPASILFSHETQSPVFKVINIEYFVALYGTKEQPTRLSVFHGLRHNLINTNHDLRLKANFWEKEHNQILCNTASKLTLAMKRQLRQIPVSMLRRFPKQIEPMQEVLLRTPNDFLAHFHIAWLYSIQNDFELSERHFNIAALQSQTEHPKFSCFTYRHLANIRLKQGKSYQALLAIESACALSQQYHPELQFERIQLLSQLNKTTQALPYLAALIKAAPLYAVIASQDPLTRANPSLKRFFDIEKEKHTQNIQEKLQQHWKNDPLQLLNLDKELGQRNTKQIIQNKQSELLKKLSPLLIFHEDASSQLIQKRSHATVMRSLNTRKQQFVERIEQQQTRASKIHRIAQWMLYTAIMSLVALGLSYAISAVAGYLGFNLPINPGVQSALVILTVLLVIVGSVLLHFTPNKLNDLIRRKQRLEAISTRLGYSTG